MGSYQIKELLLLLEAPDLALHQLCHLRLTLAEGREVWLEEWWEKLEEELLGVHLLHL